MEAAEDVGDAGGGRSTCHRPEAGVVVELGGVALRLRRRLLPIPRPWRRSSQGRYPLPEAPLPPPLPKKRYQVNGEKSLIVSLVQTTEWRSRGCLPIPVEVTAFYQC